LGAFLVSNRFVIEVAIRFTLGEDMPDRDQQSAGNRHDGFVGVLDFGRAFVLDLPIGITTHCAPGRFNQSPTQFPAARFLAFQVLPNRLSDTKRRAHEQIVGQEKLYRNFGFGRLMVKNWSKWATTVMNSDITRPTFRLFLQTKVYNDLRREIPDKTKY
jgi:hypothetical protein